MNKKQMLKLGGVTNQKDFYLKYPDEQSFLKAHGKQFRKAVRAEKLKNSKEVNPLPEAGFGAQTSYNDMNSAVDSQQQDAQMQQAMGALKTTPAKKTTGDTLDDLTKDIPVLGSLVSGITGLWDEKKERQRQERAGQLSDLTARASESAPRQQNRKYLRPDMDQSVQDISSLFPAQGTGTNVLGKDGITIMSGKKKIYKGQPPKAMAGWISELLSSGKGEGSSGGILGNLLGSLTGGGGEEKKAPEVSQQMAANAVGGAAGNTAIQGMKSLGYDVPPQQGLIIPDQLARGEEQSTSQPGSLTSNPLHRTAQFKQGVYDFASQNQGIGKSLLAIPGLNDAGGRLGNQVGELAGSAFGPVGSIVGGLVGSLAGIADTADTKMAKAQAQIRRNENRVAAAQIGNVMGRQYYGNMRTGGQLRQNSPEMENDGELRTLWGGHTEPLSYNPYSPEGGETIMFRGNSHEEGNRGRTGIGVKYGEEGTLAPYNNDANVEVESGEPAMQMSDNTGDKNLVVFGNLPIPKQYVSLLGEEAKGKKFKNFVANISKKENKQNKIVEKTTDKLNELNVNNPFDKITFDTLSLSIQGANTKLKDFAEKKQRAASLQQAINDTAEEMNIDPEHLVKGNIKTAKYGANIPKADPGIKIKKSELQSYIDKGYKQDPNNPNRYVKPGKDAITIPGTPGTEATTKTVPGKKYVPNENAWWKSLTPEQKASHNAEVHKRIASDPLYMDKIETVPGTPATPPITTPGEPSQEVYYEDAPPTEEKQRMDWSPYASALMSNLDPYLRPTNQKPLDPRQLTGEYYALATNQIEPVKAQLYNPTLKTPYEISLQDILNENTAQTRGAQRMMGYNPAAQSNLLAQQYGANQKVLGEQFRINQEMKDKVYGENINTLNDAQLKNLGILDQQAQRQAQALSNTKATAQDALSSISSKYLQNQYENLMSGVYQNMYKYRYDDKGRAINFNQPAQFNTNGGGDNSGGMIDPTTGKRLYPQYRKNRDGTEDFIGYLPEDRATTDEYQPSTPKNKTKKKNGALLRAIKNL